MSKITALPSPAIEEDDSPSVPEDWTWPMAPQVIEIYDKYSDTSSILRLADPQWVVFNKGAPSTICFADGNRGLLQRKLVLLTQSQAAPGTLRRFAATLVHHWAELARILGTPPHQLREAWRRHSTKSQQTATFKAVLKLACQAQVGHWSPQHAALVASLDTLANARVRRRVQAVESRQNLIGAAHQAEIVQCLDRAAEMGNLSQIQMEGAVTLALMFQHGMRPVQVLCLNVEHVRYFTDISGNSTCIVSFHAAKQRKRDPWEIARQVKPEWVPLIKRLHANATGQGRRRLFTTSAPALLWYRVRSLFHSFGMELKCSALALRHSAAQALADAGHSRHSIQSFLGHAMDATARVYIKASLHQASLINTALGASKLYGSILSIADRTFVSVEEMQAASEDGQIGAVVGERLVAGVGLCAAGQNTCIYNPVTSCYGCRKFLPARNRAAHLEAIAGMREQVAAFIRMGLPEGNLSYRQLTSALRISVKVISGFGERDQGRKVVLRGQEIVA
ncbi:tyrosine-type recombinase/integrase [Cupriavidus metallidurans]